MSTAKRQNIALFFFKDGLNAKALSSAAFIFFACLSGAIAFGGLMEEKTGGRIGITETLFVSSVSGVLFSLFAGMPLIITGKSNFYMN